MKKILLKQSMKFIPGQGNSSPSVVYMPGDVVPEIHWGYAERSGRELQIVEEKKVEEPIKKKAPTKKKTVYKKKY